MVKPPLMREIITARNRDSGAPSVIITGRVGAGKTSLLSFIAQRLLEKKKEDEDRPQDERLFWRGQESCQFLRLGVPIKLFIPEFTEVTFIGENGFDMNRNYFSTFQELYEEADPESINVIYTSFEELVDFMEWIQKTKFTWNSILVDEVEDLCPRNSEERWNDIKRVSDILKEARKFRLSFYSTTQASSDVDWRVLHKLMGEIYLQGARVPGRSPVEGGAVHGLDKGEGFATVGGNFEKFSFPPFTMDEDVKARIDRGMRRIPKPEILEEEEQMNEPEPVEKVVS